MNRHCTCLVLVLLFALFCISGIFASDETAIDAQGNTSVTTTMEVVVTASKMPEVLALVPRNIDVVTAAEIKESGMLGFTDILNSVEGFSIKQNGGYEGQTSVFTRGAPSKETLVMINGIPINDLLGDGADLSLIDTSSIQKIEIIKGGMSSVYGANSSAGVINIITGGSEKKPGKYGSFKYEYGSFNRQKAVLALNNKISGWSYDISTADESCDGYVDNSNFTKRTIDLMLGYKNDFLDSVLTGLYLKRQNGIPFGAFGPNLLSRENDENYAIGLNEKFKIGPVNSIISGYARSADLIFHDPDSGPDSRNIKKEYAASGVFSYDIENFLSFETGYEVTVKNVSATNISGLRGSTNQAVLGGITAVFLDEALIVNAGLRADFNSDYGNMTSENVSIKYNCFDIVDIRALFDKSFSEPTLADLYWYQPSWGMFGNPDLKPEDSTNYELSFSKKISNISGSITLFNNEIKNLIAWASPDWIVWAPVNINKASIMGAEANVEIAIADYLVIKAGYTCMNAVDSTTKDQLVYRPRNEANAGVTISLPSKTKINLTGQYVDVRYYSSGAAPLKSYYLFNCSVMQEITKNMDIRLNVNNVLDNVSYELVRGYPMPGRAFSTGFNAEF